MDIRTQLFLNKEIYSEFDRITKKVGMCKRSILNQLIQDEIKQLKIHEYNYDFIVKSLNIDFPIPHPNKILQNINYNGFQRFTIKEKINDDEIKINFQVRTSQGRIISIDPLQVIYEVNGVKKLNEFQLKDLERREKILLDKKKKRTKKRRDYLADLKNRKASGNFVPLNKGQARLENEYKKRLAKMSESATTSHRNQQYDNLRTLPPHQERQSLRIQDKKKHPQPDSAQYSNRSHGASIPFPDTQP